MQRAADPGGATGVIVLAATLTVQSLAAMALLTMPVVAPAVAQALGISSAYVGVYVALAYVGAMMASVMGGAAVRRFGAIRLSQVGLALCSVGLLLCMVPSVPAMAVGAVLLGLGYGPITPASSHLLARTTSPERMSLVFSLKQTGVPLGGLLAGMIVPGLANVVGWQAAFGLVGAAGLLCAASIQPLYRRLDADRDPSQPLSLAAGIVAPLRLVFGHRSLTVLALVSFLFSIAQLSLTTYLVTYLHEDLGTSLVTAGLLLSVSQAAGVASRLLWGYVSDRFLGAVAMLAVLAMLIALCALVLPFLPALDSTALTLVVLALFGGSAVGWNGVYLAEVARQAPAGMASVATGGTLFMTFLGVVVGPPVFGLIAGLSGRYGIAYASLLVPAGLCLWLLWRHRHAFGRNGASGGRVL